MFRPNTGYHQVFRGFPSACRWKNCWRKKHANRKIQ